MAVTWLIRRQLRRRWATGVVVTLVVAFGATGTLVALGAAHRTGTAYVRYLGRADVGDVVINPALLSSDSDALLRGLPGARAVSSAATFFADIDHRGPTRRGDLEAGPQVLVRGSTDGRHASMDRPAVSDGRLPDGTREALVTTELAEDRKIQLGDVLTVSFWNSSEDLLAEPDDVIVPIGTEHLTVVGVGTLADEVLPDDLYRRGQVLVSPDVAARYHCLPDVPQGDPSIEELIGILLPEGCSTAYPYYSLDLGGDATALDQALAAYSSGAAELNEALPSALAEEGAYYSLIATTTAQDRARLDRATQPGVITLLALAAGAGAITLVVLGLAVARELRRSDADQLQWWRLGMAGRERAVALLVPHLACTGVGLAVALVASWVLSPVGPVGAVRAVEPSPSRSLTGPVVAGACVATVLAAALLMILVRRSVHRIAAAPPRAATAPATVRLLRASGRPAVAEGLRASLGGNRDAGLVIAISGVATAVLLAAVVFGASLRTMVDTPAAYGWPWDVAMMGGAGYGSQDVDAMIDSLSSDEDVAAWTALAFTTVEVGGVQAVGLVALGPPADLRLTMAEGALPRGAGEVALGHHTAARAEVGVGDRIEIEGEGLDRRTATVSGIVVLPALGPYQADRAAPGDGVLIPAAMVEDDVVTDLVSFVGIDVAAGVDPKILLDEMEGDAGAWALDGSRPVLLLQAVRPPEVIDAASLRSAPLLLGGVLALAAAVALSFSVALSVRARRRELGTLRALGFTGRQLRTSVLVQAVTIAVTGLVVGVPLGIVIGRSTWRAYAARLGVGTEPIVPLAWIVAAALGAVAISVLTTLRAGRNAARTHAGQALRAP